MSRKQPAEKAAAEGRCSAEMVFFIIAEFVSALLVFAVGFLNGAITRIGDFAPWILSGMGMGLILTGMHSLIRVFREKTGSVFFLFAEAVMLLGIFPGVVFAAELVSLDRCGVWMAWLGSSAPARIFTALAVLSAACMAVMLLAFAIPLVPVRIPVLLLTAAVPICLYFRGLSVCTESYSAYMASNFALAEPFEEYEVTEDTALYYPSFEEPALLPILLSEPYSGGSFEEGTVVYLLSSMVAAEYAELEYIPVSDGERSGYVAVSALRELDEPVYEYSLAAGEDGAQTYRLSGGELAPSSVLSPGEALDYMASAGEMLKVRLTDGNIVWVLREDAEVVKTPAS